MTESGPVRFSSPEVLARYIESERFRVLGYIDKNLGPGLRKKIEPDDIFQELCVAALAAPEQFEVDGREPFKLLCQIAEQRIIDAHRRLVSAQKRSAERERSIDQPLPTGQGAFIDLLVASLTSASQAFSRNQKEFQLMMAMESLSAEQREAIRLRFVDGWATKEIAEKLGKTDGAIRVLLSRTISQLQTMVNG
jgi:RNA polymerase sigma-70 factor (ECF subfamily)